MSDAVSAPLRALLELFAAELAEVKFPELDAQILRGAAEEVSARAEALSRAETALERARVELGEAQEALLQKGHRALAYARIFAEDRPELTARVEAITLPRGARKPTRALDPLAPAEAEAETAPRRRGRPPKLATSQPLFPGEQGEQGVS